MIPIFFLSEIGKNVLRQFFVVQMKKKFQDEYFALPFRAISQSCVLFMLDRYFGPLGAFRLWAKFLMLFISQHWPFYDLEFFLMGRQRCEKQKIRLLTTL